MKKISLFTAFLWVVALQAQETHHCGTTYADQLKFRERLLSNIANGATLPENSDTIYIPVFFHLTANTAGTNRPTDRIIIDAMCTLNSDFAEHKIQFYVAAHPTLGLIDRTINNDNVNNNQSNTFLMNLKKHQNAVNYYVVDVAATNNSQPGGAAAYYSPARDWIVANRTYLAPGDNTIAHETGHFFSLAHTFFGWEADAEDWENQPPCFDPADAGWPCAPAISPGGSPTEKADGSNCTVAADGICDTPPDYNFGFCQSGCAPYNGGAQDPMCQPINPMENNFMSYFSGCADYIFTPGQETAMKADINSVSRNFLDNTYTPPATTLTAPTDMLVSPANNEVVATTTTATLTWNAVPGATMYMLELDRFLSFSTQFSQLHIVTGTSFNVTDLSADRKYYWRVRPLNEHYWCANTQQRTFTTAMLSGVETIDAVAQWTLSPNPTVAGQNTALQVTVAQSTEVLLRVFDIAGREVYSRASVRLVEGENTLELPVADWNQGVYMVSMSNGAGVETKRLVIAE
jgi:Secretion system C-terminal sorting domain